jgi:A/G-specific adenine glycosylase
MEAKSPSAIPRALLAWYADHARVLPWRIPPGAEEQPDPYRVWLSEVMLQQTTTVHVIPYFDKFTRLWPTVEALAAADEASVMAEWAGLGYYSRARNLVTCARLVAERGGFPEGEAELLTLPGVGEYTAAALAAIAQGRRAVVIDANVERVVARLFSIEQPLPEARPAIRAAAGAITPDERAGDFAQAMMDLGATICSPRNPKCLLCPLASACQARARGIQEKLPMKPPRKAKPKRTGTAFWIEREGRVWLVTRPAKGMLGAMRALPDDNWSARHDGSGEGPLAGAWRAGGVVDHSFTHFDLELGLAIYAGNSPAEPVGGEWWPILELDAAGLPTLFAKAARLALAEPEKV